MDTFTGFHVEQPAIIRETAEEERREAQFPAVPQGPPKPVPPHGVLRPFDPQGPVNPAAPSIPQNPSNQLPQGPNPSGPPVPQPPNQAAGNLPHNPQGAINPAAPPIPQNLSNQQPQIPNAAGPPVPQPPNVIADYLPQNPSPIANQPQAHVAVHNQHPPRPQVDPFAGNPQAAIPIQQPNQQPIANTWANQQPAVQPPNPQRPDLNSAQNMHVQQVSEPNSEPSVIPPRIREILHQGPLQQENSAQLMPLNPPYLQPGFPQNSSQAMPPNPTQVMPQNSPNPPLAIPPNPPQVVPQQPPNPPQVMPQQPPNPPQVMPQQPPNPPQAMPQNPPRPVQIIPPNPPNPAKQTNKQLLSVQQGPPVPAPPAALQRGAVPPVPGQQIVQRDQPSYPQMNADRNEPFVNQAVNAQPEMPVHNPDAVFNAPPPGPYMQAQRNPPFQQVVANPAQDGPPPHQPPQPPVVDNQIPPQNPAPFNQAANPQIHNQYNPDLQRQVEQPFNAHQAVDYPPANVSQLATGQKPCQKCNQLTDVTEFYKDVKCPERQCEVWVMCVIKNYAARKNECPLCARDFGPAEIQELEIIYITTEEAMKPPLQAEQPIQMPVLPQLNQIPVANQGNPQFGNVAQQVGQYGNQGIGQQPGNQGLPYQQGAQFANQGAFQQPRPGGPPQQPQAPYANQAPDQRQPPPYNLQANQHVDQRQPPPYNPQVANQRVDQRPPPAYNQQFANQPAQQLAQPAYNPQAAHQPVDGPASQGNQFAQQHPLGAEQRVPPAQNFVNPWMINPNMAAQQGRDPNLWVGFCKGPSVNVVPFCQGGCKMCHTCIMALKDQPNCEECHANILPHFKV